MKIEVLPEALWDEALSLWHVTGIARPWNDPADDLRRAMTGSASTVLACTEQDQLLGTAMVGHDGHRGWVYYLAVVPAHQERGVGRKLMEASEEWVREHGITKIQVMIRRSNTNMLGFYKRLGYADDDVSVLSRRLDQREILTRRAGPGDATGVARMWLRSRLASAPVIPASIHSDEQVEAWFSRVVLPERETWVIDAAGVIVAALVLEPGWIDQLYVDPDFAGRGLGSRLLDLAKGVYPSGLDLWTFQANTRARHFYEQRGFVAMETTDGDNEEGAPDVRYHWAGP